VNTRSLILVLSAACGSSTTVATTPTAGSGSGSQTATTPDGPVTLSFQMFATAAGGRRPIAAGDSLRSGDRMTMTLTVDRPAYGYVLQFFPDGTATVLFPQGNEDNRITGSMQVPPSGAFELDDVLGEETVYVVASMRPLAQADATVMAAVDDVRRNTPEAAPPPTPTVPDAPPVDAGVPATPPITTAPTPVITPGKPGGAGAPKRPAGGPDPGRAGLKTRGIVRVAQDAQVIARSDADGIAIFNISFKHVPRK